MLGVMVSAILEGKPDKNLILVTGRVHPKLAQDVADQLGIDILETTTYDFANGEMYVRYTESVRGADVFVLQSHYKPINKAIMEQLIMIDALKRASARSITAVSPAARSLRSFSPFPDPCHSRIENRHQDCTCQKTADVCEVVHI